MIYRNDSKKDLSEKTEESEDSGEETTLIPKSLLPDGAKPGDEIRLKIVHSYEDELEVSYAHSNKDKSEDESPAPDADLEEISADA